MRDCIFKKKVPNLPPGYFQCQVKVGRGLYLSDLELITKDVDEVRAWFEEHVLPKAEPVDEEDADG